MYYVINKQTRELIRQSVTPFNVDETVQPPAPNIQLKQVVNDTRPTFNAATQKLVQQSTDNDAAFTRTLAWVVVPLSQPEIDAYQKGVVDEATRVQIKAVYNDLKNGVGTVAERAARLEKAVAWLLRNVRDSESFK